MLSGGNYIRECSNFVSYGAVISGRGDDIREYKMVLSVRWW